MFVCLWRWCYSEPSIWNMEVWYSQHVSWIKCQYAEPNTIFGKFIQILPKDGRVFNFWKLPNACGEDLLFWCFFLFSNLPDFCFFVINGSWNVILPCHSTKLQEDRKLVIWWKYYLVIDRNTSNNVLASIRLQAEEKNSWKPFLQKKMFFFAKSFPTAPGKSTVYGKKSTVQSQDTVFIE